MINVEKSHQFSGHSGSIYSLCNGREGIVYSGSGDGIVAEWNYHTFEPGKGLAKVEGHIYSLYYNSSNHSLGIGQSLGGVHWIDLESKKEIKYWKSHHQGIFDIQKSELTHQFIISSASGEISIYDEETLKPLSTVKICNEKIRNISCHPTLPLIALACSDCYIRIFDLSTLKTIHSIKAHEWACNAVFFRENGQLISGSRDAHLKIWDFKDSILTEKKSIPAHNFAIYTIEQHPQQELFATASRDKTIKLWNSDFDILLRIDKKKFEGHVNSVNTLVWTGDGKYLVSAGDDKAIMFWELRHF
jgi:WD40 repeat protein